MRIIRHLERGEHPFRTPVVAIGNFDGVHRGHRVILDRAIAEARRLDVDPVVYTFHPHPVAVLFPERAPQMICSVARRVAYLRDTGVAGVVLRRFTEQFSRLSPEAFVRDVLRDSLGISGVVVGYDVTFGRDRRGTPDLLQGMGQAMGFSVEVVSAVEADGLKVSSSAIRRALEEGDVGLARGLLGRSHRLEGRVTKGDRRGATIGFPTANIFPRGGLLPPDGVYAVRARVGGEGALLPGVANLGLNPTFGIDRRRMEIHLFEFDRDIYGARLEVDLEKRLRGEIKFPTVDALVSQIRADAGEARDYLGAGPSPGT